MPAAQRPRRSDPLSRESIVAAAIDVLDADGEANLTFKALTARLSTGAGAIYHHISNKNDLLAAATDQVVAELLGQIQTNMEPPQALRAIALAMFDAIDIHPWIAVQLSRDPLPAVLRIWKAVGEQLQALGIDGPALSDAGAALVNYVLGAAAQHVAGPRTQVDAASRQAYLQTLADHIKLLDPDPAANEIADQLRDHDDRQQFLTGVDIFLTGITLYNPRTRPST